MSMTQSLRRSALLYKAATAILDDGERTTYGALVERVSRLAAGLRALGVVPGDRVGVLALNGPKYLEYYYAVSWAGAVFTPVNTRLADAELAHWITDPGAKVLFVDRHFASRMPQLRRAAPVLETLVFMEDGPAPDGFSPYGALLSREPVADAGRRGDDLAGLFYTGGTTGRSKGVMITHDNLAANLANVAYSRPITGSVALHTAPMFHMADFGVTLMATAAGAAHAFQATFTPEGFMAAVESAGATSVILVPTMISLLLNDPGFSPARLRTLTDLIYGASPMPAPVLTSLLAALPGCNVTQGYGQTEASPGITVLTPADHLRALSEPRLLKSAGRAMLNVDLAILDPDGAPLPPGAVGEVCIRGANVMKGYWNLPEQTAEALRDGWLHTGDGGYLDEEGYLYIVDRLKDMIVTGGENVYCAEVEGAIHQHPAVAECAVIGVPHETWGEAVHAVVRLKPGAVATAEDIIEHCRPLLGTYKRPRGISFSETPLPLSGAGKILKTELRKPFWAGRDRAVS